MDGPGSKVQSLMSRNIEHREQNNTREANTLASSNTEHRTGNGMGGSVRQRSEADDRQQDWPSRQRREAQGARRGVQGGEGVLWGMQHVNP